MPDRILRADILTSEPVNQLSWPAEVFYRRLMSVVDDFGRYEGRPSLLRAALYPLQIDKVSEPDVVKWMGEVSKAGLVRKYTVDGKEYVEITKFRQRLRAMKSKYPAPADIRGQMTASDDRPPPETKRGGDGFRNESETESEGKAPRDFVLKDQILKEKIFLTWRVSPEQLSKMLDDFELLLAAEGKTHDESEYKKHFRNWGAKRFTEYRISQTGTKMTY
jgi:hypothetical protein